MYFSCRCVGGDAEKLLCVYIYWNKPLSLSVSMHNRCQEYQQEMFEIEVVVFFFSYWHMDMQWSTGKTEIFGMNCNQAPSPEASSHPLHGHKFPESRLDPKVGRFLLAGGRGRRSAQFHLWQMQTFCSGETFTEAWIIRGVLTHQPKDPANVRGLLFRLIRVIKK